MDNLICQRAGIPISPFSRKEIFKNKTPNRLIAYCHCLLFLSPATGNIINAHLNILFLELQISTEIFLFFKFCKNEIGNKFSIIQKQPDRVCVYIHTWTVFI